jgi:hypothetical protein
MSDQDYRRYCQLELEVMTLASFIFSLWILKMGDQKWVGTANMVARQILGLRL